MGADTVPRYSQAVLDTLECTFGPAEEVMKRYCDWIEHAGGAANVHQKGLRYPDLQERVEVRGICIK
ncbi:hypothetical protein JCM11491_001319 [Sporobolomyces phaffii]